MPFLMADFNSDADYNTTFNSNSNDNCTVTLNGWTETFVNSWDGTKAALFDEKEKGTGSLEIRLKTPSGANIVDTKGLYFEFKFEKNYSTDNEY